MNFPRTFVSEEVVRIRRRSLNSFDVIIIGAGPTGLISALLLADKGLSVCVIEKHSDIYPLPRAISFDHEVARILNLAGVLDEVLNISDTPDIYQWKSAEDELLFELNWANDVSVSGYAHSYVFSQPDLERILNKAASASASISIHRGYTVTHIQQGEETVIVDAINSDNTQVTFTGSFAIGADGANSVVRQQIDSGYTDLGFKADWLVVDVVVKQGVLSANETKRMLQICDPHRPTTIVSGGPGRRRWEFMALENETLEELNTAERAWSLLKKWGITPENARLERHAVYTFRGAVASTWSDGRIFIAGDAAHLTPPFAGQGLCAGFRDAAALAWRIALAAKQPAYLSILKSYESERKQHARLWVENAIELGKVICELEPEKALQRNTMMLKARKQGLAPPSSGILPALGPGLVSPLHRGGMLGPGGFVTGKGDPAPRHFDDVFECGFHLITVEDDIFPAIDPQIRSAFLRAGGQLTNLSAGGDVSDTNCAYASWLGKHNAKCVLMRPDFYVFGVAEDASETGTLLKSFLASFNGESPG